MPLDTDDPLFKAYIEASRRLIASHKKPSRHRSEAAPAKAEPSPRTHDPFRKAALEYLANKAAERQSSS